MAWNIQKPTCGSLSPSTAMSADVDITHGCFFEDLSAFFALWTCPSSLLRTITAKGMTTVFLWIEQRHLQEGILEWYVEVQWLGQGMIVFAHTSKFW